MDLGHLHLGTNEYDETIKIPTNVLKRHVAVLGASGSGKTVFGKVLIEEAVITGIPSIIVDPQGDLASLAIVEAVKKLGGKGFDKGRRDLFKKKAEVRVFTPASSKGIPISINPLKFPKKSFSEEEMVRALDLTSTGLTQLIGYSLGNDSGKACQNFLYTLLKCCWQYEVEVKDFAEFSQLARDPTEVGFENAEEILNTRLRANIATKLNYLSIGMDKLLFNFGTKVDMDNFLRPVDPGSIPVNVIYLNTLTASEHKQFFVAMLAKEIYTWMLQNPSDDTQLIFYIDEVGPYIPPHPFKPPSKEMISFLFKQGRKYGVSCFMCTQNPADVDYKAMSQANTLGFGRMMTKQDLDKIKHILKSSSPQEAASIIGALPSLSAGNFILVCPDVYRKPQRFQVRWLYTKHLTLDEEHIRDHVLKKVVAAFKKHDVLPGERVRPGAPGKLPAEPRETAPPSFAPPAQQPGTPFTREKVPGTQFSQPQIPGEMPGQQSFQEQEAPLSRKEAKRLAKEEKKARKAQKQAGKNQDTGVLPDIGGSAPEPVPHHVKLTMGRRRGELPGQGEGSTSIPELQKLVPGQPEAGPAISAPVLAGPTLIPDMAVKLSQATKMSKKVMKTKRYSGKVNLGGGKLVLLPLWYVKFTMTVKKRLWFFPIIKVKKSVERGLFFNAENGGLLQLTDGISFNTQVQDSGKGTKDLDEVVSFRETTGDSLPAEAPAARIPPDVVMAAVREGYQVTPSSIKLALLPVWSFEVRNELGELEDRIFIDAALGKTVER